MKSNPGGNPGWRPEFVPRCRKRAEKDIDCFDYQQVRRRLAGLRQG